MRAKLITNKNEATTTTMMVTTTATTKTAKHKVDDINIKDATIFIRTHHTKSAFVTIIHD